MEEVTGSEATQTTFATWRPSHTRFLDVLSNGIFIKSQPLVPHEADDKAKIRHRPFRLFRNYTKYRKCPRTSNISVFHVGVHNARTRGTELRSSVIRWNCHHLKKCFPVPNPTATKYTKGEHIPLLPKRSSQRICIVCVCACVHAWSF